MASDEKKDTVRKELQAEFEELADSIKTLYKKEKDRLEDTVYQLQLELSVSEIINFFNSIALIRRQIMRSTLPLQRLKCMLYFI